MKKDVKLYNMILPTFMLMAIHPLMWILSVVGNFVIDSIVLLLVSFIMLKKIDFKMYKSHILLLYFAGFVADFVGGLYLFIGGRIGYNYIQPFDQPQSTFMYKLMDAMNDVTNHSDIISTYSICFMISAILFAAIVIFVFDYMIFRLKGTMSKKQSVLSALMFAVLTAPYTYFLPPESFNWYFNIFGLHW